MASCRILREVILSNQPSSIRNICALKPLLYLLLTRLSYSLKALGSGILPLLNKTLGSSSCIFIDSLALHATLPSLGLAFLQSRYLIASSGISTLSSFFIASSSAGLSISARYCSITLGSELKPSLLALSISACLSAALLSALFKNAL